MQFQLGFYFLLITNAFSFLDFKRKGILLFLFKILKSQDNVKQNRWKLSDIPKIKKLKEPTKSVSFAEAMNDALQTLGLIKEFCTRNVMQIRVARDWKWLSGFILEWIEKDGVACISDNFDWLWFVTRIVTTYGRDCNWVLTLSPTIQEYFL